MTDEQPQKTILVKADSIRNVRPKMVTITRSHSDARNPYTTIDLPIEAALYTKLLQATNAPTTKYSEWLPFVFLVNEKGKAFDFMPQYEYTKKQKTEKRPRMTPHKQVTLKIPLDLLCNVWKTRKRNQTLDNRFTELIQKGIKKQKQIDFEAEINKQFEELIKEGKVINENIHAHHKPRCGQPDNPKTNPEYQNTTADTPKHPL